MAGKDVPSAKDPATKQNTGAVIAIAAVIIIAMLYFIVSGSNSNKSNGNNYTTIAPTTANLTTTIQALYGNVTISSSSCTKGTDSYGNPVYNVQASGTATGPAWARLEIAQNPGASPSKETSSCSTWGAQARSAYAQGFNCQCYRGINDPANTTWTYADHGSNSQSFVNQNAGGAISVTVLVQVFANITSQGDVTVAPVSSGEATNNSYIATEAQASVNIPCP